MVYVCALVCPRGGRETETGKVSTEAAQVKPALYRQLLYLLHSCTLTVHVTEKICRFCKLHYI